MSRRVEVTSGGLQSAEGPLKRGQRFDADLFGANAAHLVKSGKLRWVDDTPAKPVMKKAAKPAAEG